MSKELLFDSFEVEYETIGKLRFRRYRDLLGAELEEMEQHQRRMTQAMLQMMTLSKRISDAKGIPFEQVFEQLGSGQIQDASWMAEFGDEAFMLMGSLPIQSVIDSQMIALFAQSRAEVEGPDGWMPVQDWTIADSRRLPGKYREQVLAFIRQEQAGDTPAAEPAAAARGKRRASAAR